MVMGRLMLGSPPRNDAGNVPVAVPTNVPCSEVLLHGPFPAGPTKGLFFSNATTSSPACVSICSFLLLLVATCLYLIYRLSIIKNERRMCCLLYLIYRLSIAGKGNAVKR